MDTIKITKKEWEVDYSMQMVKDQIFMSHPHTVYKTKEGYPFFTYKFFDYSDSPETINFMGRHQVDMVVTDWLDFNEAEFKEELLIDKIKRSVDLR